MEIAEDKKDKYLGASTIKYEIITLKGVKVLIAKRCALRHQYIGLNQIENVDNFEYKPQKFEQLFGTLDENQRTLQEKALQKTVRIKKEDICEVIGQLEKNLVLVQIK